ncbi:hypothetical protein CLV80_103387 [Yoonia maritima]|uniref:Response regulatory domain-containing protein n=1 Tax=Yoonia maritima TaxID=1435347 RepID=A0A2T0W286_9RHOB|nr:imidazoleglycerol-phosphate dehydratase [Yoonia maritima]PRY79053.1 hypothetical protein CLV80_103387 [Yoonia maritima]
MKALIMRSDPAAAAATARVFVDKGFQILCMDRHDVACALVKMDLIDLLVMDEEVEGKLTHSVALSGERHNPFISTILLTDRVGSDMDELYELIPCLHALVGQQTPATLLGQLAVASVSNKDFLAVRAARSAQLDVAEQAEPELTWAEFDLDTQDVAINDADIPTFADVAAFTPALADPAIVLDGDHLPRFSRFEQFDNSITLPAHVAHVSIIGGGRPSTGAGIQ